MPTSAPLDRLLPAGFVTATGGARLGDLTRYAGQADRDRMRRVHAAQHAYDELVDELPEAAKTAADVRDIAWQIEELRVSLWAQQLGTPRPVSEQRIHRAIDAARQRYRVALPPTLNL